MPSIATVYKLSMYLEWPMPSCWVQITNPNSSSFSFVPSKYPKYPKSPVHKKHKNNYNFQKRVIEGKLSVVDENDLKKIELPNKRPYMHTYRHLCMLHNKNIFVYIYTYKCIYMCVYKHIYIYIYTLYYELPFQKNN